MAKSLLKDYLVSLESDEEDLVELTEEEAEKLDEEIEEIAAETDDDIDEIETLENDAEELEEISEGLEAIVASLEASIEQGGLDAVSAQFLHHAVEGYVNRLGTESSEIVPALENFGGDTDRLTASTEAMEKVKEWATKAWAAIKAAVEKTIRAIGDFFAKLIGGVEKLKTRGSALLAQISKLDNKFSTSGEIKVSDPNLLNVNGKLEGKDLLGGIQKLEELNKELFGPHVEGAKKIYAELSKTIKEFGGVIKTDPENLNRLGEIVDDLYKDVTQNPNIVAGPEDKVLKFYRSGVIGNKGLTTSIKVGKSTLLDFTKADDAKSYSGNGMIKVIDRPTMVSMVRSLNASLGIIAEAKKKVEEVNKARKDNIKDMDAFIKGTDKSMWEKFKAKDHFNAVQKHINADVVRPMPKCAAHTFSVARAAFSLIEKNIAAGTKEEKKA